MHNLRFFLSLFIFANPARGEKKFQFWNKYRECICANKPILVTLIYDDSIAGKALYYEQKIFWSGCIYLTQVKSKLHWLLLLWYFALTYILLLRNIYCSNLQGNKATWETIFLLLRSLFYIFYFAIIFKVDQTRVFIFKFKDLTCILFINKKAFFFFYTVLKEGTVHLTKKKNIIKMINH